MIYTNEFVISLKDKRPRAVYKQFPQMAYEQHEFEPEGDITLEDEVKSELRRYILQGYEIVSVHRKLKLD